MPGEPAPARPERQEIAPGLTISRIVTGLWQVADMERGGATVDLDATAAALAAYVADGFDSFDMADHYGSAELIAGRLLARARSDGPRPVVLTKWCPPPGPMTEEVVRSGIAERLERLGTERIDLLQLHWWTFEHPAYLDAMKELTQLRAQGAIGQLGVTNFDTNHLRLLRRHGFPVLTNQVCISLLDRRATEALGPFCAAEGVHLLAYGTLAGGFLCERWLDQPEPTQVGDWSKMKYKRFIDAAGGWTLFQELLRTLAGIARRHDVSIANVATRWVLDQPGVAAVIVGARPGEREHRADNGRVFAFALDEADRAAIAKVTGRMRRIPGDCGDEYRRPPFLTATGDLSHHLDGVARPFEAQPVAGRSDRWRVGSGSVWEAIGGYSRAVRVGDRILVAGTTATHGAGELVCPGDVAGQTVYILDKIAAAVAALGGSLSDVVRTRIYLRDVRQWEAAARVHGSYFAEIRPANTLVQAALVGAYEVEIEAEAVLS